MEISSRLSGADLTTLQTARQPQRGGAETPAETRGGVQTAETQGVRVTLSAEARAAEQVNRPEVAAPVSAPATAAAPVEAPDAASRLEAPVASADAPVAVTASPTTTSASQAGPASSRPAAPEGNAPAAQVGTAPVAEPDAPTASASAAVQLYRENQRQPDDRPPVSEIRASA